LFAGKDHVEIGARDAVRFGSFVAAARWLASFSFICLLSAAYKQLIPDVAG